MITIDDECNIEIVGDKEQVLYQVRGLIETLAEVKEFKKIFENDLKFFNPNSSRKEVREIILYNDEGEKDNDNRKS